MHAVRIAKVVSTGPGPLPLSTIERYLPSNYQAVELPDGSVWIVGQDVAGWGLDTYVIPRLASGLIYAKEFAVGQVAE